jgi:hypothetical protein
VPIPKREGARYGLDAIALRPLLVGPRIGHHDVDICGLDMASANFVAPEEVDDAGRAQILQDEPAEPLHARSL